MPTMFCPKCGNVLPDTASFCNKCGSPTGVGGDGTVVSDGSDRRTKVARIIVIAVIAVALVAVIAFVVSHFVLGTSPERFASRYETFYENFYEAEDSDEAEKLAKKYIKYYLKYVDDDVLKELEDAYDCDDKKELIDELTDVLVETYEMVEDYLDDVEIEIELKVGDELTKSEIGDLEDEFDDVGIDIDVKKAVWIGCEITVTATDDLEDGTEKGESGSYEEDEFVCIYKDGFKWYVGALGDDVLGSVI